MHYSRTEGQLRWQPFQAVVEDAADASVQVSTPPL